MRRIESWYGPLDYSQQPRQPVFKGKLGREWLTVYAVDVAPTLSELERLIANVGWELASRYSLGTAYALQHAKHVFTARFQDHLVGFARVVDNFIGYKLEELIVHPTHQGYHIGTALLANAEQQVQADRGTLLTLQSLATARDFYAKRGYVNTKDYFYEKRFPAKTAE